MLPKTHRLGAAEVREILKSGKTMRRGSLLTKYLSSREGKAAVVVSKKVARSAVERNRIRRTLYQVLPRPLPHRAMVFMVMRSTEELVRDVQTICSKLF